jgi:dipeptidyl aminopeptidase/acylaminoacyl peptidase
MHSVAFFRHLVATISALGLLCSSLLAQEAPLDPNRPGVAVLTGVPERELTDPGSLVSAPNQDAKPISVEDVLSLRTSWFATWTPDGKDVVFTSDLTGRTNLWRFPHAGGFPQQLHQSENRAFYPTVSPDGNAILYASDVGGNELFDIFAMPGSGGEPVNLTSTDDVSETGKYVFSTDSKLLAFVRREAASPTFDLALLDLATREVRQVTRDKDPGIYWSPVGFNADGTKLIANRGDILTGAIWMIDLATGEKSMIASGEGKLDEAVGFSSDNRYLSVTSEAPDGVNQAVLVDLKTGERRLMVSSDWPQEAGQISPDGKTALVINNVDGSTEIMAYDIESGKARALNLPKGTTASSWFDLPQFSPDGKYILFPHSSASVPFDYWTHELATGVNRRITRLGLASVNEANLPKSQTVSYKSADGTVISAILWMPYNLERDGSAPIVVIAHGGPTGQTVDTFDATAVALASRGYIVIAPNVRGSTGYGRAFMESNRYDLGGRDLEDEAWAAKFVAASGYGDLKKVGITGGSYGGYMSLIAIGRMPDFWAASVEVYGIVNWRSMWERGSPALREYQRELLGSPETHPEVYDRTSPLTYLDQVKAPLLVLQGENDLRVPAYEAEQVVEYLQKAGKTVDSKIYAEEGHGFDKRENQIDALQRTVDWFDRYLKEDAAE